MKKTNPTREYFIKRLNQYEEIQFKKKVWDKTSDHKMTAKIVEVTKDSVKFLAGGEQTFTVEFENIIYFGND